MSCPICGHRLKDIVQTNRFDNIYEYSTQCYDEEECGRVFTITSELPLDISSLAEAIRKG
jgi:C4-type Zn-finger protein